MYEIRVYNHSPEEVAIRVFIDGLDLFHFSDDRNPKDSSRPKYTYSSSRPPRTGTRRRDDRRLAQVDQGEGELPGLPGDRVRQGGGVEGGDSGIGTGRGDSSAILAVLSWTGRRPEAVAGNETGFGPPRKIGQEEVAREVEPPIDVVSVRYTR